MDLQTQQGKNMPNRADQAWELGTFACRADLIDLSQLGDAIGLLAKSPGDSLLDVLIQLGHLNEQDISLLMALWTQRDSESSRSTARKSKLEMWERESQGRPSTLDRSAISISDQRFEILEPIARGGLGQVSLALDSQLNRKVAVKSMLPKNRNDAISQHRFLFEAEITGELEHPAIVPIYGVGIQEDGSPYYAMRLIHGRNLREVVDEFHRSTSDQERFSSMGFRRILSKLIDASHAIEFAHTKNVIHRDIKPSNIIIGENGEAFVVDWGMAKRLSPDADESSETLFANQEDATLTEFGDFDLTHGEQILGTPAYMSPEQAGNQSDVIGPLSDIFSLGATLYFILTNKSPYSDKTPQANLMNAVAGKFDPPRQLLSGIPIPLEAICLKAMANSKELRYQSVFAFIEDCERWLGDEPISAWKETSIQKFWRFVRRNRTLSQVVLAALSLIAVTAIGFSILLKGQMDITKSEKDKAIALAEQKTTLANEKSTLAEEMTRLANEKAALADKVRVSLNEANSQNKLALSTLRNVVWNIQRKLKPIDSAQSVRRDLLDQALAGLDRVAKSLDSKTEVDRASVLAHNELGMIYLTVGNADGKDGLALAIKHFELARSIGLSMADGQPGAIQPQRDVSITLEHLGDAQMEMGDYDKAEQTYRESLGISVEAEKKHSGDGTLVRDIAFGWEKVGNNLLQRGNVSGARDSYIESQKAFQSLLDKDPTNVDLRRDCVVALSKIGNIYAQESNWEKAAQAYRVCLERTQKEAESGNEKIQTRDRSVLHNKLGDALRQAGKWDEAAIEFEAGLKIAEHNLELAPESSTAQRDLAISFIYTADVSVLRKDLDRAESLFLQSLRIRKSLVENDPNNFADHIEVVINLSKLGKLEQQRANVPQSMVHFAEARKELLALNQESIDAVPEYRNLRNEINASLQQIRQ